MVRREKSIVTALERIGCETWLPTVKHRIRWSDRTKYVQRPIIPGYVFVRLGSQSILEAVRGPGIMRVLGEHLHPTAIPDEQIERFRQLLESKLAVIPCNFVKGLRVTVHSGPLSGLTGVIVRVKGALRLVIAIEMIRRAVSVEVDAADVAKAA